jgi:glycerophosphoryl diester phosphodiesterase
MDRRTIKINSKNTKMVAHQGLFGLERGNSNQAFIAAGNREKYYGIETDVHRTADGKYVCIHDSNTKGVSGVDMDVESSTLEQLQSIRLMDVDGATDRADIRIPTLKDYIKICRDYGKVSVLELKTPFEKEHIGEIIDIIRDMGHLENTVFISFHKQDLIYLREYLPDQPAQFLTGEWNDSVKAFVDEYRLDLDICWPHLTKEIFDDIKSMGKKVNIWTVDDKALGEKFADWGADYLTTNILE